MSIVKTATALTIFAILSGCRKDTTRVTYRFEQQCFQAQLIAQNIIYSTNTTQLGAAVDLTMDIYGPADDNLDKRPLIIFAHGGHFKHGGKIEMTDLCRFFAESGYVAATINYTLVDTPLTTYKFEKALTDGIHDMNEAVRFFMQDASMNNKFRIDPSTIFIGGYSVGAMMALQSQYIDESTDIIRIGGDSLLAYWDSKGGLAGHGIFPEKPAAIAGIINISGGISSSDLLDFNGPPIISFHGVDDIVVPIDSGFVYQTNSEIYGSRLTDALAESSGIQHWLFELEGGHGSFQQCNECPKELRKLMSTIVLSYK